MFTQKNFLSFIIITAITLQLPVFADDISDMKAGLSDTIAKLIQTYEGRIQALETENNALKKEIFTLKGSSNTQTTAVPPVVITSATSKTDIYNSVIKQMNTNLGTILSENNLPGYAVIGLFEFIEPNAVFLSLDDGNNPANTKAFKTKILYTFDSNLIFTKIGLFDLDYTLERYRTLFGTNPYTKEIRVRMPNPNYKGKLLDTTPTTGSGINSTEKAGTTIGTGNILTTDITFAQIKALYSKNKNLDVLKMSEEYMFKNPNDVEVLKMRYRSYYFISKYIDALSEIKKIETIQGATFEKTIACDAAVIGKIAKKTDTSTYYSALCKKK